MVDTYELSDAEMALLPEVCRMLDDVEDLARRGRQQGIPAELRLSIMREARLQRLALGRLLLQLELPTEAGEKLSSPAQARARKAANARWGEVRRIYGTPS